jgi:guanylate kinase
LSKQFSRYGILFVISAPSGAGKTTLCDAVRQTPDFVYSVSCTTRPPRAGEIDGEDYQFLTEADFLARVKAGEFLEHAKVHEHYYGTLQKPLVKNLKNGIDVLIDIDTQGAAAIRNCGDEFIRRALSDVFIMPPDLEELRRRLTKRGSETPKQIELRLRNAARESETVARLSLLSSVNHGRGLAKIPPYHGRGTLFKPPFDSEIGMLR